ncbi:hypothetical protein [Bacillus infantis]|uniref:hypothetical protein n=1 Tax=Bacillus infantis TaxID=324767 RepID=UPI003CEE1AD2
MYSSIIEGIDEIIKYHNGLNPNTHNMSEKEAHYFIQGLEVAKQTIRQFEEFNTDELAHETFEEVVVALKETLDEEDMKETINHVFGNEEE